MKKLLLCAGLIIALVSCSDSSSTEPEVIQPDNSIRLNKMVKIDYDSNGGVNSVFTTNYRYDSQNRLNTIIRDLKPGYDSTLYFYLGGNSLAGRIVNKNSLNRDSTVIRRTYDGQYRPLYSFLKQYNQGALYYSDSAAFVYNGSSLPSQVLGLTNHYSDNTNSSYSNQFFYDGSLLTKAVQSFHVRELYYKDNLLALVVDHSSSEQDSVVVDKVVNGKITKVSTRNNHNGLLSWELVYDSQGRVVGKKESRDSVMQRYYIYSYGQNGEILNVKYYTYSNGSSQLSEYQYEYTAGRSNSEQLKRMDRFCADYIYCEVKTFLPWENPVELP